MTDQPLFVTPAPRKVGELASVQYLRGIAAMMVVVFHLKPQLERMGYWGAWLPGLSAGVDIFFVISGFIMWVTTSGKPITPWTFWRRRIIRIVPLYWLVTSFTVTLMLLVPAALQTSRFDGAHVVASYLFFAWPHPAKAVLEPVVMPGWTLNYEMFFYLVFGLFLLAPVRWRMIGTVGTVVALVLLGWIAGFAPGTISNFYTSNLMLEFALGMALGWVATRGGMFVRVPRPSGWAMLILGLAFVALLPDWAGEPSRLITRGIASTIVVAGALVIEEHGPVRGMRLLKLLGDASYSIYLSHVITMSASSQAWRKLHLPQGPAGLVLFSLGCTVACGVVGWLCYRFAEKPLIHVLRPRGRSGAAVARSGDVPARSEAG